MKSKILFYILISILILILIYQFYFITINERFENINKIPKKIIQTNKIKPKECVINTLLMHAEGWEYYFFDDIQAIKYFKDNPIDEFPNIEAKFNEIPNGAHKADLFRYYILYNEGGVFIDSDAMLECDNLSNEINNDIDFFSVNSSINPNTIFQGFLGCSPKNNIVYQCLKHAYNADINELNKNYLLFCKEMYDILNRNNNVNNILLFEEEKEYDRDDRYRIYEKKTNKTILYHYFLNKNIECYL
jgi:hypothetical protein